jgi:hypothetical protein
MKNIASVLGSIKELINSILNPAASKPVPVYVPVKQANKHPFIKN